MDIDKDLDQLSWLIEEARLLAEKIESESAYPIDVYEIAKQRISPTHSEQVLH